jgi:hypothetical protein
VVLELEKRKLIQECSNHPGKEGQHLCRRCFAPICEICRFPGDEGLSFCPVCCQEEGAKNEGQLRPDDSTQNPAVAGLKCSVHPDNDAAQLCQVCGARVCKTCDFFISHSVHLCPTCASRPNTELSKSRKNRLVGSYVLAGVATVAFAYFMSGMAFEEYMTEQEEEAVGYLMSLTVLLPSIIGVALSMGTKDKRLYNPPAITGAIIWNTLLLVIFVIMAILGNFME